MLHTCGANRLWFIFIIYNYLEYYMLCFYFKWTYSLCQYELFKIIAWRTRVCQALALFPQVKEQQQLMQILQQLIDTRNHQLNPSLAEEVVAIKPGFARPKK